MTDARRKHLKEGARAVPRDRTALLHYRTAPCVKKQLSKIIIAVIN